MHLRRGLESSGVATNGAAQYAFLFRTAFCYGPIRYTEGAYVDSPGGVFSHQSRVVVDSRSGTSATASVCTFTRDFMSLVAEACLTREPKMVSLTCI
jgi:hypothetical protein